MNTLRMTYKALGGKNTTISISNVKSDAFIDDNAANEIMDEFISSGAVQTATGKVVAKIACALYKQTIFPYTVA